MYGSKVAKLISDEKVVDKLDALDYSLSQTDDVDMQQPRMKEVRLGIHNNSLMRKRTKQRSEVVVKEVIQPSRCDSQRKFDESLQTCVDDIWQIYDEDEDDMLNFKETYKFMQRIFESQTGQSSFMLEHFLKIFPMFGNETNSPEKSSAVVTKSQMVKILKQIGVAESFGYQ